MSINQSRANKSESHFRKPSRPTNSAQPRPSSGGGGKGGAVTGLPPAPSSSNTQSSSSLTTNRSFKKSHGQGAQSRVSAATANPGTYRAVQNGARAQPPLSGASDAPVSDVSVKQTNLSSQRSYRAGSRAPSSQSTSGTSDSTAPATPIKGDASRAFSFQFGSISPGFMNGMQVPARTSSAPPSLDEQKRDQARQDSIRSGQILPTPSIPREQHPRKDVEQSNSRESHPPPQVKKDVYTQVPAAPVVPNTQSSSALPVSGVSLAIPFQQPQVPIKYGVPSPQIQPQGVTATSLQMPVSLPVGNSTQVQQQLFVPSLQPHPLQSQGMMQQGQGLNFTHHMGHQLGSQFGNLGIGITPQFAQQQVGKFGTPRKTVKITHPETHEELRLDKRNDMNLDAGSSGPRSHPNVPIQSQPVPYASPHQINYYSRIQPNPMFFQNPTSLPLTSTQMASRLNFPAGQGSETVSFMNPSAPGAQAVVFSVPSAAVQVTVKPSAGSIGEKVGTSSVSAGSPVDKKVEMPKLLRPTVEAGSFYSQGASTILSENSIEPSKSVPEPTAYIPLSVTTKHSDAPTAADSVDRLQPSPSDFTHAVLPGETASVENNTEGRRREPVRRSDSIKDHLKKPSKKGQQNSQPQQQAETSNSTSSSMSLSFGASREGAKYHDNMQTPPSKLVEPSTSISPSPSLGLERSSSSESRISETVECKATPAPSETCEAISVPTGESLPSVHTGIPDASVEGTNSVLVGENSTRGALNESGVETALGIPDASVEGTNSVLVGKDSTRGAFNESGVETASDSLDDVHIVNQGGFTLQDIQKNEGIKDSAGQQNDELSEQPQLDNNYIDDNNIKMDADSFSLEFSKVNILSEQDFSSIETTVGSKIGTMEVEQNELKKETSGCSLEIGKMSGNFVRFTAPSPVSNDSEISIHNPVLSTDCCEIKTLTLEASKSGSLDDLEVSLLESGMMHQESLHITIPVISATVSKLEEEVAENANGGLVQIPPSGFEDKPTLERNRARSTTSKAKKKRKEILQKADAAGTTSDLYMAYKGPEDKPQPSVSSESVDSTSSIDARQVSPDANEEDVAASKEDGQSKAELDDWEDAADISTPKLETSDNGEQFHGGLRRHVEDENGVTGKRKYSRDFLLTLSGQRIDLPAGFEVVEGLMGSKDSNAKPVDRNPYPGSGRIIDRPTGVSRPDHRGSGMLDDDKWSKSPGPLPFGQDPRVDIGHGGIVAGFRPGQGGNHGALRNMRGQAPGQYVGGILSGPLFPLESQGGIQRNGPNADRWQRAPGSQKGLIPSPQSPLQVMHKAGKKYEIGKVTDEEEAKQRQLKAILNKLTPQNFDKLFERVKEVNIDNSDTLTGVISQIFDKALTEPTFCEMYANFCYHLAGVLPDFSVDNEKITFKRLLLNKCQEEFERGEREQAEADRVEEDGEVKQSEKEREEKKVQARRRMLGNIRLIGELYKKKMLTERIMHECIKKLLGQYQNHDEEDIEALCKLMSTIGEMIDHPKAKEHMDAYFDMMTNLSNNMKLSSRVRFMLKDAIDLRKNKWQQRRKVEGPKKIEDVHRDAAQERQAQSSRLAHGSSISSSARRGQPVDFGRRGSTMLPSPNTQMGAFHGLQSQGRGFGTRDVRLEDRHPYENRTPSVPLPHRRINDDSITLGPQGGLGRGMSIRGQPMLSSDPLVSTGPGDSRRMAAGPNGYNSVSEWTPYKSREEPISRYVQDRFVGPLAHDQSNLQENNMYYGNRDLRNADRSFDRSVAGSPVTRMQASSSVTQNVSSEKVWPEERLREMSMAAIREFYSASDENEVALCIKDLNSPIFHPSMISIWVTDSFERKDRDRDLLARLLVTLTKSRDSLLSPVQLIDGVELVLATLEDAVTDAPKAAEFFGRILAKIVTENVISLREIGRLIHDGGDEPGRLLQIGLGYEVLESTLEMIRSEKGESDMNEMLTNSNIRLEDFRPPKPTK